MPAEHRQFEELVAQAFRLRLEDREMVEIKPRLSVGTEQELAKPLV